MNLDFVSNIAKKKMNRKIDFILELNAFLIELYFKQF